MRTVYVQELMRLPLGKQGENGAARIVWQGLAARYQALYGSGAFTLTAKRCGDAAAYPVAVSTEGGDVVWLVQAADVANPGSGSCELTYTVDGAVAKSQTWSTYVAASISGDAPGEPPEEPAKAWFAAIQAQIGNLDDLTTKAKDNLVGAINEADLKGKAIQPDYQQNDPTAPDYIKNRPGGYTIKGDPHTVTLLASEYPTPVVTGPWAVVDDNVYITNMLLSENITGFLDAAKNNAVTFEGFEEYTLEDNPTWTIEENFCYYGVVNIYSGGKLIPGCLAILKPNTVFDGSAYPTPGIYMPGMSAHKNPVAFSPYVANLKITWSYAESEDVKIPEKYLPERTSDIVIFDGFTGRTYEDIVPLIKAGKMPFIYANYKLYTLASYSDQSVTFRNVDSSSPTLIIQDAYSNPETFGWSFTYSRSAYPEYIAIVRPTSDGSFDLDRSYSSLVKNLSTPRGENSAMFIRTQANDMWWRFLYHDAANKVMVFGGAKGTNILSILTVNRYGTVSVTETPILSPSARTDDQTQEVGVDAATGKLYTKPGDLALGITGAQVGQIAKITAVDASGVPTAWSPVDMAGGETKPYKILYNQTLSEAAVVKVDADADAVACNEYILSMAIPKGDAAVYYNAQTIILCTVKYVNNIPVVDASYGTLHQAHLLKSEGKSAWLDFSQVQTTSKTPSLATTPRTGWNNMRKSYATDLSPILYDSKVELPAGTIIIIGGR